MKPSLVSDLEARLDEWAPQFNLNRLKYEAESARTLSLSLLSATSAAGEAFFPAPSPFPPSSLSKLFL